MSMQDFLNQINGLDRKDLLHNHSIAKAGKSTIGSASSSDSFKLRKERDWNRKHIHQYGASTQGAGGDVLERVNANACSGGKLTFSGTNQERNFNKPNLNGGEIKRQTGGLKQPKIPKRPIYNPYS